MIQKASALLVMGFLALACSRPEPEEPTAEEMQQARLERAQITLEAAPEPVRDEVLKTCDKWEHIDHACLEEDVRKDQLECWLEEGLPELQIALRQRIGPRARNLKVMLKQNLCMELRRWRKLERGPDF